MDDKTGTVPPEGQTSSDEDEGSCIHVSIFYPDPFRHIDSGRVLLVEEVLFGLPGESCRVEVGFSDRVHQSPPDPSFVVHLMS